MDFRNDIFVSYAHIDNQALGSQQRGWIAEFERALQIRVGQLLGKEPRIWRDPKLQGNDVFADKLVDQLPTVALLVSVLSPRYIRSEWCQRELREFLNASKSSGGLRVGDKIRVFKVVKTPVPIEQHPPELQAVLGYEFFTIDPGTGRARELQASAASDDQRHFWAKLDDLAYDIVETLQLLESGNGGQAAAPAADEKARTVFLAETSFDLQEQRDAVKRELLQHGHTVMPDRTLPLEVTQLAEVVREELARCELSIHLIGKSYGVVPEGTEHSVIVLQNELAAEHSAGCPFPRLVWMPPGLTSEDKRQADFIVQIQTDARMQAGADLLETSLEDLKAAVHLKLTPAPQEKAEDQAAAASEAGLVRIYLICDLADLEHITELEDFLFDQGYEVILPAFEGDETHVRLDHQENLCLCDAVLFYYGAGSDLWLRSKLRDLQKSAGFGRTRPFLAKAIYVAPPPDPRKQRLRTHEADVVQAEAGVPAALESFVGKITAARKAAS